VAVSAPSDEVWVAEGTYTIGQAYTRHDLSLYGGFSGSETVRDQRNPDAHPSVLAKGVGEGSFSYVYGGIGAASVVDGFTLSGVSIVTYGASPVISHNLFRDVGTAIANLEGSPLIVSNTMSNLDYGLNSAGGSPVVLGNRISGYRQNGVDYGYSGPLGYPAIVNNVFEDGDLLFAVNLEGGDSYVAGNLMTGSRGGVWVQLGITTIVNNTIVGNHWGLSLSSAVDYHTVANNIVAFNWGGVSTSKESTGDSLVMHSNCVYGNSEYDYNNMKDATGFQGNVSADPQFVNNGGDYGLSATSPLIDAGDDAFAPVDYPDLDGHPRIQGAHVDLGAYERAEGGTITLADAAGALRIFSGLSTVPPALAARLDVEPGGGVDIRDATRLARKAAGLDANP
jgi:parallel beta-helix repeat protein